MKVYNVEVGRLRQSLLSEVLAVYSHAQVICGALSTTFLTYTTFAKHEHNRWARTIVKDVREPFKALMWHSCAVKCALQRRLLDLPKDTREALLRLTEQGSAHVGHRLVANEDRRVHPRNISNA